ncbi:MAG TPA: choice-of-anchor D domain-containing protein, partial [Blastocatellia bacterium]|nr:choice-of-anchor D domain-containing protein [Blastocatellia bacterium]
MKASQRLRLFLLIVLALVLPASWYFVRTSQARGRWPVASTFWRALVAPAAAPVPMQVTPASATLLRTLAFHQITSLTSGFAVGTGTAPVLSGGGNRAVFSRRGADVQNHSRIFVVDADGTPERQVDAYAPQCGCDSQVDISSDGTQVVSSDSIQLRSANADGTGARELVTNREIAALRISGDGTKVFFLHRRGEAPTERGLYVVNTGGGGLRQIVGPSQVASLLGITRDNVFPFNTDNGPSLSVSHDGSRIIFSANIIGRGQQIFGVNLDGSGLHSIAGPSDFVNSIALSADGLKVAYLLTNPPCCSSPRELYFGNFDGTGQRKLSNERNGPIKNLGNSGDRIQLSSDGAKLLLGASSILLDTTTGAPLQLGVPFNAVTDAPPPVVDEGMGAATMNSGATRFLYVMDCTSNFRGCELPQLGVLDLNPVNLGQSPGVTEPRIEPNFVLTQNRTAATVSARVTTSNTMRGVGNSVLLGGLADGTVGRLKMVDNGSNGDATSGDGIFTHNTVRASSDAVVGARTMRVKAEVRAGDGRRHATAIDFEPFTVTNQTPLIDVSPTHLDFGNVNVNTSKDLTVTIRNTGTVALTINTISSNNAVFTAPAPSAPFAIAAGAQQLLTVRFTPTATGAQSGRLTINSSDPARPSVDVTMTGVGVAQTCTYSIAPTSQNFAASGGSASVNVTTQSGCAWTATSNAAFITINSGTPGSGNGTLNFSVAANTGTARSGTITIAGQTFTVTQDAAATTCTYSIAPTNQSFGANGGTGSVTVTTQTNCAWTATSNANFITINSGTPGNGSGTLNYGIAVNTSTAQRSGTMTIAGNTFTVNQSGTTAGAPLIRIEPTTLSFNAARSQSLNLAATNPRTPEPINIQRPKTEHEQKREDEGEDHADKRRDWFYRQRQYPFEQIPDRARERAIAEKMQAQSRMRFATTEAATEAVAAQWTHIGPSVTTSGAWGRVSGRVTSIIVHPTNPNIVYISGAQGG